MNYQQRINNVIDYIGQHLDEDLSLELLCQIACFSKHHFHRVFTATTGASLKATIKWLRLKRAAHQLSLHKDEPIIHIALRAGFETHESFSRAFKQACGQSPKAFREQPLWRAWETPPHALPTTGNNMNVQIKTLPSQRLAVVEHHGDPMLLANTLDKLIAWAKAQPIDLKPKPGEAFGIGYHDPREVPANEFRFDLALKVPEHYNLSDEVNEKILPAGRYAITMHKGSRDNIGDTIFSLYRDWLPDSGEEPGELPCIFSYQNFDHEVAETELLTEIWVLLK